MTCPNCGSALVELARFCGGCGAPNQPVGKTAKSGNVFAKIIAIGLSLFILAALLGIGSLVYAGYRVKKKAQEISQIYKKKGLGKLFEPPEQSGAPLDKVEAWNESPASQTGLRVPLRVGLTIVSAIATSDGDYESIKRITSVTASDVRISVSSEIPSDERLDPHSKEFTKVVKHFSATRIVSREDLRTASLYMEIFQEKDPDRFPHSTAIGTSAEVLKHLKDGQSVKIGYAKPDLLGPATTDWTVHRVEPHPVPVAVLMNDRRV